MTLKRSKLAALALAAMLAAPAGAWAQGAVDEEYRESVGGGGGSDAGQPAPSDDTQTPTAPAGSAPAAAPAPEQTPTPSAPGQLPRTGLPAVLIAVTGATLLAAGTALRRRPH